MLDRAVLLSYHILMIIKVSNKRSEARAFMQLVMVLKIEIKHPTGLVRRLDLDLQPKSFS